MQIVRDLADTIGIEASHFDILITAVIVVGAVWAVVRLFQDFTRPLDDDNQVEAE